MINYYLITKPGIIMGNLITVVAGFILGSYGMIDWLLFFYTLAGMAFIMASACVLNNFIDRKLDKKMNRTKKRALVQGLISGKKAIFFALVLGIIGNLTLLLGTNILTLIVANVGFFVYVLLYSLWKAKTIHGTFIGSIAGATPPVVGYCAASNQFDLAALILFAILVFWQMPHFFAIAINHLEDYTAAKIPLLPIIKGTRRAKWHMLLYILAFIIASLLLTLFNYTSYIYLTIAMFVGLIWLGLSLLGFKSRNEKLWAKSMFRFSLIAIMFLCGSISFFKTPQKQATEAPPPSFFI